MPGLLLRHPSSLEHDTGAHPECAARITAIESALAQQDWLGCEVVESPAADHALLEAVHSLAHIDRIEGLALRGGGMIDMDTTVSTGSYAAAHRATTPAPPARWASAWSTASPWPLSMRWTPTGWSA